MGDVWRGGQEVLVWYEVYFGFVVVFYVVGREKDLLVVQVMAYEQSSSLCIYIIIIGKRVMVESFGFLFIIF